MIYYRETIAAALPINIHNSSTETEYKMNHVGNVRDRNTNESKQLLLLDDGRYVVRNPRTHSAHPYDENRYEVIRQQQPPLQQAPQNPYPSQPNVYPTYQQVSQNYGYAPPSSAPPPMQYTQAGGSSGASASAQREPSKLERVREISRNLPRTDRIEIYRQENEYDYKVGKENECIADERPVMAEGVAGCIAICGIGYIGDKPYHAVMHCGSNALSTERDARDCLREVMGKLSSCASVRLYLVGGDDEGEGDAENLLAHKNQYPIVGAKVCFSPGSGTIQSVDVVVGSGRVLVYGKNIPSWVA